VISKPDSLAVGPAAQSGEDVTQGPVVHVHHPLPDDPGRVDAQRVAVDQVVVQGGGQQVVGGPDGVEVAREVQIDLLHGHHLGIAAPGRPALEAEAGPQGWFPDAQGGPDPQPVQAVGQANAGGGLALPGRGGGDGRDQDQLAGGLTLQAPVQIQGNLGLGLAERFQILGPDPQFLRDPGDGQHGGRAGDVDIGRNRGNEHECFSGWGVTWARPPFHGAAGRCRPHPIPDRGPDGNARGSGSREQAPRQPQISLERRFHVPISRRRLPGPPGFGGVL